MRAVYVDGSAFLRGMLPRERSQPQVDLADFDLRVASELLVLEATRKLDRLRLAGLMDAKEAEERWSEMEDALAAVDFVEVNSVVLKRARLSFGEPLASLDAIHFATALLWREDHEDDELVLATHDAELAAAARANGLPVVGA